VLAIVLYERLSDWAWSLDELSRGLRDYSSGNYEDAATHFSWYVAERADNYWARYYVALSDIAARQYDSAATQVTALLDDVGRRTSDRISYLYQSQELLHYGLGALRLLAGDTAAARASLGEALTENLAFSPAHALLGDIAFAQGDSTQAVTEYALALELRPDDGMLHYRYARLLADVGRLPDAERELRRAIELEPLFAPPYLGLALVLDTRGSRAEALEQYRRYLERTVRNDPRIPTAQERIRALSQ
jgi:tetratricopeptide (TPR) repeat protein